MKELEVLLSKRWILKSRDKEMYYKLRDALGELRKFTTEKMGCQIIDNSLLIKMEKIPVIPESFMGIMKFSSKEEYAYLCMLLMYLEDRDAQEQFILSQLTEYITANLPGDISDWTLYTNRRKLIRVLRFAVEQGIVGITDGKDEAFMDDEAGEVLYENTGASRYFMKSFSKDIMEYTKPEDFRESDWFEVDEDRGFAQSIAIASPSSNPCQFTSPGFSISADWSLLTSIKLTAIPQALAEFPVVPIYTTT